MTTTQDLRKKYYQRIAPLDMELLFSFVLKKPREFILAHPEHKISKNQELKINNYIQRGIKNEPIAYILGKKEFYGIDFKVTKDTLIPRPETELIVDLALEELRKLVRKHLPPHQNTAHNNIKTTNNFWCRGLRTISVVDVGTGSGNIIISIAKQLKNQEPCLPAGRLRIKNHTLFGIDISNKALAVAKQNAKAHKLDKKIKFLHGNLLDPILKNKRYFIHPTPYIILANLPYLSSQIYAHTPKNVRSYEPKSALYSPQNGLKHYTKLLKQITSLNVLDLACYMEISPEQKPLIQKIIKQILLSAQVTFYKDLAQKWRVCKIEIQS